jgi:hypothetical protein
MLRAGCHAFKAVCSSGKLPHIRFNGIIPMQGREHINSSGPAATEGTARGEAAVLPENSPTLSKLLHDLNQPLSAINNYAQAGSQLIDSGMADLPRLKDLFAKIVAQSSRATGLSQQLGDVVKAQSSEQKRP